MTLMKDYDYEYEYDIKYCYPQSKVLINKLNITDGELLEEAERKITSLRTMEASKHRIEGKFDFAHLKKIHKFLFGELYDWAGQIRSVNISKGNQFCKVEFINEQMEEIFDRLKKENYLRDLKSKEKIAERLAWYLGEINAIHPFREGNGRAQRLFIEYLAYSLGYWLDFMDISKEDMMQASARAFNLDYSMMEQLIYGALEERGRA